jgi:predicted DNA binding CopG/RHH family protein
MKVMRDNFATQVSIRLKPGDYELFRTRAEKHGMTLATYIRVCALKAMRAEVD